MIERGRIHVVGLGPAGPNLITCETRELLDSGLPVFLRTGRHPAAADLSRAGTFDEMYESSASFAEVYSSIVTELHGLAASNGEIVYAVPGSPTVGERTVELLVDERRSMGGPVVILHPAMSFAELAWLALEVDPLTETATIVDAHRFADAVAGRRPPFLVTQVHSVDVLYDVRDVLDDSPPAEVTVLQRLGSPDESVRTVTWDDLDASIAPDHLTSLWVPGASLRR